jgi:hypothetical protein
MGICMHKILRIIYGMLKHNKPFNPQIDIDNRKRNPRGENDRTEKITNRRFQDYDAKAPVTKRQRKKRLERERSNSATSTKSGITTPAPLSSIIADLLPDL